MFDYLQTKEHPAFNLSLRCNFVDGTSGTTYLKLVGSKGSIDVKWEEVVVRLNAREEDTDPFLTAKAKESSNKGEKRARILSPQELVYKAENHWKGAHYDHFGNWLKAIRQGGFVVEYPDFRFHACAPALL